MDEHGFMQGLLTQRRRDTEAAKIFLNELLWEYDVPEAFYTEITSAVMSQPSEKCQA